MKESYYSDELQGFKINELKMDKLEKLTNLVLLETDELKKKKCF